MRCSVPMKKKPTAAVKRPRLAPPPAHGRARELWLQHAAGAILFSDVRGYALGRLDPKLDANARDAAARAIDDALYGVMMVADGVTGGLANETHQVALSVSVRLEEKGKVVERLDLADGDGVCMAFHCWRDVDFGTSPVLEPTPSSSRR
jgi:hypothetical protein